MKVRITNNRVAAYGIANNAGETVEVADDLGTILCKRGLAEEVKGSKTTSTAKSKKETR